MSQENTIRLLRTAAIAAVLLGAVLRFVNVEDRVVWLDESATALRVSGYGFSDLEREVFDGGVHTIADLERFQRVDQSRGIGQVVEGLAREEAGWPPLHFVLLRLWTGFAGDSMTALRLFSSFVSLLCFPLVFWLARELAPDTSGPARGFPWAALALFAASPFHLVYAQEARAYALWTVATLAACAAFLRALRTGRSRDWVVYGGVLAVGFYTFPFTAFVAAAHLLYAIVRFGPQPTRQTRRVLVALVPAGVAILPWAGAMVRNLLLARESVSWTAETVIPIPFLVYSWISNVFRLFVDLPSVVLWLEPWLGFHVTDVVYLAFALVILGVFGFGLVRFLPDSLAPPVRPGLFLLCLILIPFLLFAAADLVVGGIRSFSPRHQIAGLLGVQLLGALILSLGLLDRSPRARTVSRVALVALLVAGLASGAVFTHSRNWWNKYVSSDNDRVAAILHEAERPVLVGFHGGDTYFRRVPFYFLYFLSLSHVLRDDVAFRVSAEGDPLPPLGGGSSTTFLVNPTEATLAEAEERGLDTDMVYGFGAPRIIGAYYFTIWEVLPGRTLGSHRAAARPGTPEGNAGTSSRTVW
jgi:uncharacterized membrane protein